MGCVAVSGPGYVKPEGNSPASSTHSAKAITADERRVWMMFEGSRGFRQESPSNSFIIKMYGIARCGASTGRAMERGAQLIHG